MLSTECARGALTAIQHHIASIIWVYSEHSRQGVLASTSISRMADTRLTKKYRQDCTGATSRCYRQEIEKETKNGQGGAWYKPEVGAEPEKMLDSNSI